MTTTAALTDTFPQATNTATDTGAGTVTDQSSQPTTPLPDTGTQATIATDSASADREYRHPAPHTDDAGRGMAIASFVIGLASIVSGWTFFAPLTGLILGIIALRRRSAERTLAIWGVALNGAILAIMVILIVAVFLVLALAGAAGILAAA